MKSNLKGTVVRTIEEHHLLQDGERTLVAVSGGADSVALLLLMTSLGYDTEALHCNFHLRGKESDRDEEFVRALCQEKGIKLWVKHFDTTTYSKEKGISIEMAARDLRYQWFEEMLRERRATSLCVAHHKQDQAETLLLNLVRGTGIRGLAGMHYRNGHVVRPLLDSSRQDIEEYLKQRQQAWVNDSTNAERDAQRNIIRLDILPLLQQVNPQAISNMADAAKHIQEALPIYERGLQNDKADSLTELHEALQGCGFNSTQEENIWKAKVGSIVESDTHRLLKDRTHFILCKKGDEDIPPTLETRVTPRAELTKMEGGILYLDNDKIHGPLSLRKAEQGDSFQPFGMKGRKLVSDLLTDLKLNRFEKEQQYVLIDGEGQILWVVNHRASALYPISQDTENVLCIKATVQQIKNNRTIRYGTREED